MQEVVEVILAQAHLIEPFFPDRRFVGIEHFIRQGIDEEIRVVCGLEVLLLPFCRQEFALDEFLDDRRPRRFGADALDFFQFLLQAFILDVLIDFLHRCQERRRREPRRRLRRFLVDLAVLVVDAVALADRRQGPLFFVFLVVLIALIEDFPARHGDGLAVSDKGFVSGFDDHARLVVFMDGIELGQIGLGDEIVDMLLHRRQFIKGAGYGRRDDGVMGRDFAVVPGAAAYLAVGTGRPFRQLPRFQGTDVLQDPRYVLALVHRQVFAVRPGIGRQFPFVQFLGRIEDLLRRVAIPLAGQDLQGRQGQGQALGLFLLGLLVLDNRTVRPSLEAFEDRPGRLFIDTAPFRIEAALGIAGLPLGADDAVLMKEIGFDDVIRDGHEVVQFPLAADDESQGRRLDAANGKDDAVPLAAGSQGIRPGQVHADEPVGAAAGQG